MKFPKITRFLPDWKSAALAVLSAILLILAFPDFEFSFLAWFALIPLLWAVEREKESLIKSFAVGWVFGTVFFFGTCWWLTFAPITYAAFPPILAYSLFFCVALVAGLFPAIFAIIVSVFLRRFTSYGIFAAPFIWIFAEFLRYWLTGNNWNAIGYSQAFGGLGLQYASLGGIYLSGFLVVLPSVVITFLFINYYRFLSDSRTAPSFLIVLYSLFGFAFFLNKSARAAAKEAVKEIDARGGANDKERLLIVGLFLGVLSIPGFIAGFLLDQTRHQPNEDLQAKVVAIQPNVPMAGLTFEKWKSLRHKHVELAEFALSQLPTGDRRPTTVIFPESPMNFAYEEDKEFQRFVHAFAAKHDVNVLFNSAEPDAANNKYFNSAVLVGPRGSELAQYDKIYLVPFGESVPAPLQSIVPAFVGSFSYGSEYDLVPLGDAKAGIMICFESHFGQLSREYVRNGADVLIEMTNDGYLGPTPVLRQHLANAVFRAVETNRPVLRVTNVGITAYINERGQVIDPAASYTEDTRIWTVSKSDGGQTFYVRYGDWFAWVCSIVTIGLLIFGIATGRRSSPMETNL